MFQFETIPGIKKARGFFITISNLPKNSFYFRSLFPLVFLPERVISLKNGDSILAKLNEFGSGK